MHSALEETDVCIDTSDVVPANFINFNFTTSKIIVVKYPIQYYFTHILYIYFNKCYLHVKYSICKDIFRWMVMIKKMPDHSLLTNPKLDLVNLYMCCVRLCFDNNIINQYYLNKR
jgi:hypothetical protein